MKQSRNTTQTGRLLRGSDRNTNEWSIDAVERTQEGVKILYTSARKLSGASYVLELSREEVREIFDTCNEGMSYEDIKGWYDKWYRNKHA